MRMLWINEDVYRGYDSDPSVEVLLEEPPRRHVVMFFDETYSIPLPYILYSFRHEPAGWCNINEIWISPTRIQAQSDKVYPIPLSNIEDGAPCYPDVKQSIKDDIKTCFAKHYNAFWHGSMQWDGFDNLINTPLWERLNRDKEIDKLNHKLYTKKLNKQEAKQIRTKRAHAFFRAWEQKGIYSQLPWIHDYNYSYVRCILEESPPAGAVLLNKRWESYKPKHALLA